MPRASELNTDVLKRASQPCKRVAKSATRVVLVHTPNSEPFAARYGTSSNARRPSPAVRVPKVLFR